ncbi:hypothetical protein GN958_ATG02678 [Phytophthora infestans]|uniref:Uncharacterized protein n=1 Tax=Phytophthora infestans TaxID=4787 RepID=A0A8S9V584_PHYIN|nr:hypothetical protein GN958_ATG02678 [Phytophthora infestans]
MRLMMSSADEVGLCGSRGSIGVCNPGSRTVGRRQTPKVSFCGSHTTTPSRLDIQFKRNLFAAATEVNAGY